MITARDSFQISHSTVIELHEAMAPTELASALFKFVSEVLLQEVIILLPRPLEFEMRAIPSRPEFQKLCDDYVAFGHKDDIWLKRSPIGPELTVVRHSLYTPKRIFRRSRFYKTVMVTLGCEYGVSLVAWNRKDWLGTVTIYRTEAQGDFRDEELPILEACQLHFESAVKRIASFQEERLGSKSLAKMIWGLPTAGIVLDWSLKPLYWNASSQELITEWKTGTRRPALKRSRHFSIPGEIQAAIEGQRAAVSATRGVSPKGRASVPLSPLQHPRVAELSADISYVPSKSLSLSKGTFLVVIHRRSRAPNERDSTALLAKLTRRERDVVLLAAEGKKSGEIAENLGTSAATVRKQLQNAYGKLEINSRYELMSLFARNPLVCVNSE